MDAIARFLEIVGAQPGDNRRSAVSFLMAVIVIVLNLFPILDRPEVSAGEPGDEQGETRQTLNPETAGTSLVDLLENVELLLDTAQYDEVRAEWVRIAPRAQQLQLKPQFAAQLAAFYERAIKKLLEEGAHEQAIAQWEQAVASHPQIKTRLSMDQGLSWALPRAYVRIGEYEDAIRVFREHYYESPVTGHHEASEDAQQRMKMGEQLLFGRLGTSGKDEWAIGRAQCALCHAFSKDSPMVEWESPPYGPHFFDFVPRIEGLIASPQYKQRPRNTVQPEAFPDSGIATSVVEYLAESNVCPSCFVVPGFGVKGTQDRESPMPNIHMGSVSLTVDEMIAIDTWMLVHSGAGAPALSEMRAAYDKFLPREDRRETPPALFLASLYDAKGDLDQALDLVEAHYPAVWRSDPEKTLLGYYLREWQNDRTMFSHLKKRPDLAERFPLLLQSP